MCASSKNGNITHPHPPATRSPLGAGGIPVDPSENPLINPPGPRRWSRKSGGCRWSCGTWGAAKGFPFFVEGIFFWSILCKFIFWKAYISIYLGDISAFWTVFFWVDLITNMEKRRCNFEWLEVFASFTFVWTCGASEVGAVHVTHDSDTLMALQYRMTLDVPKNMEKHHGIFTS